MAKFFSYLKFTLGMILILGLSVVIAYSMFTVSTSALEQNYHDNYTDGCSYLEAEDYENAIASFEAAYVREHTEEAAVGLAKAWFGSGDAEKAIKILANRMGLYEPTDEMEALMKQYKESIGIFDKIVIGGTEFEHTDTYIVLENVTLTAEDIEKLSQFKEVVTLSLNNCGISDISFLKDFNKLMSLTLTMNPISDFSALADKPELRSVYLNDTAITEYTQLYHLTHVNMLNVRGNWITNDQYHALEEALPNTEVLVSSEHVIDMLNFAGVEFASNVEELDLSGKGIAETSALTRCYHLKKLNLSNNRISWISGLGYLNNLNELNLSGNQLSSVEKLSGLIHLTSLNLAGNSITNLIPMYHMLELTHLDVSGNPIYYCHDTLARLTKLEKLNISDTGWKDANLQYIPMENMKELDLRNNRNLSQAAVTQLAEQYPNCTILHDYQ